MENSNKGESKVWLWVLLGVLFVGVLGGGAFYLGTQAGEENEQADSLEEAMEVLIGDDEIVAITDELEDEVEGLSEEEILEVDYELSRETTIAESDYTLEDDTGYGFAYDAANVLDLDYSTAWCQGDVDPDVDGPWAGGLTLRFAEAPSGMTFGIVPGFARDETIYEQNNRVKTLVMAYGGALAYSETFEFEDEYAMQFFEMPDVEDYTSFVFYVTEVYEGSKYDDTCIAEIDFWSDWVDTKDADAAYNYYQDYKAGAALRPVGLDSIELSLGSALTSCGRLDIDNVFAVSHGFGWDGYYWKTSDYDYAYSYSYDVHDSGYPPRYYFYRSGDYSIVASLGMNEWAEEGDEIVVKWVSDPPEDFSLDLFDGVFDMETIEVDMCSDGALYSSVEIPMEIYPSDCLYSECYAKFYYDDRFIGETPALSVGWIQ